MPKRSLSYAYHDTFPAVDYLRARFSAFPPTAILTGTGLGGMIEALEAQESVDYHQIPNFPVSTVQSHAGRLTCGQLAGHPVAVLQGRFHLYEGYTALAVTFPIRILQALGVRTLMLTNASGGLNPAFEAGVIMVITDHINLTGANPLIGPDEVKWGPRFPDMTAAYDQRLCGLAQSSAEALGIAVKQGVYAGLPGPSLETPAEMRYLRTIGADAVGFSTVMETIAAVHGGLQVLGLSTITNLCRPDHPVPAGVEEIIATAQAAAPRLAALIAGVLNRLEGDA